MKSGIYSIGSVLKFVIGFIGIVLSVFIIGGADTTMAIADQIIAFGWKLDWVFYISYIALLVAVAAILIFATIEIIRHPKSLIGVAIFAILLLVSYYGLSGDEVIEDFYPETTTPLLSKLVGGGLIATYIIGAIALASILYSEVSKLFK